MKNKYVLVILGILLTLFISSFTMAMANESKETSQKKSVEGYTVELFTEDPLTIGEHHLKVLLTENNEPVKSPIKIMAKMDKSDESMEMDMEKEEIIEKELTADNNGEYKTELAFDNSGKWLVSVTFENMPEVTFKLNVEGEGTNWTTLGGFMGIIALLFIVATIFKKKAPAKENLPLN